MGGKAALLMVFGFAYIFSVYQLNTGNITTRAAGNYVEYYTRTVAHEIAVSGMNIAASKLYDDYTWRGPMQNVDFSGGDFDINFGSGDPLPVYSVSEYEGQTDTVIAFFSGENLYTKYTIFTAQENGVAWIPGDTVWGPVHTNSVLNHKNNKTICFYGKVSAGKSISSPPKNSKTRFLGGYEVGNFLPEVTSIASLINGAASGGYTFPSPGDVMKIFFNNDGTVDIYQNSTKIYDDIDLSVLSPNGAIYSAGAIEILGGTVNTPPSGVTIGSGSNVVFRDAISYADNPVTNPNSDDLLGIVSWNNIVFDNSFFTDWNMQCVLMAVNGSLTAVDMNKGGSFNYYGSIYQKVRGNAKMFQSFQKKYRHD
ncbi:MAG: hypothetical protein WAN36_04940, partial [Calditrichia bacterium]